MLVLPVPAPARTRLLSSPTTHERRCAGVRGLLSTASKNPLNAASSDSTKVSFACATRDLESAMKRDSVSAVFLWSKLAKSSQVVVRVISRAFSAAQTRRCRCDSRAYRVLGQKIVCQRRDRLESHDRRSEHRMGPNTEPIPSSNSERRNENECENLSDQNLHLLPTGQSWRTTRRA